MLPEEKDMLKSIVARIADPNREIIPAEEKNQLKSILEKILDTDMPDIRAAIKSVEKDNITPIDQALRSRLESLPAKRYKSHEQFKIVCEFLLSPLLPELIEGNNVMHRVHVSKRESRILSVSLQYEKSKKPGILYSLSRFFKPWKTGLSIKNDDYRMFVCEYYRYSYFALAERLKNLYYEKLHDAFHIGFAVVDKTK
jgi:hypothetical protein